MNKFTEVKLNTYPKGTQPNPIKNSGVYGLIDRIYTALTIDGKKAVFVTDRHFLQVCREDKVFNTILTDRNYTSIKDVEITFSDFLNDRIFLEYFNT